MNVNNFKELSVHIDHDISVVTYGLKNVANVALECNVCNEILLDYDNDEVE